LSKDSKKEAETRLRRRIRRALGDKTVSASAMRKVEDEVLTLMRDYVRAPRKDRDKVYTAGERRILKSLHT
jgi:hypothetical protein